MLIFEAVDVDQHVRESEIASLAVKAVRAAYAENTSRGLFTLKGHPVLELAQIKLFATPKAETWTDAESGDSSVDGWCEDSQFIEGGSRICLRVPADLEKRNQYIASRRFEAVLRHEFQHHLDKVTGASAGMKNHRERNAYVNSDIEYSAFFKQHAEPMLAWLRSAKNGETEGLRHIEPDFQDFVRNGQNFRWSVQQGVPFREFDKKTRIRFLRDLKAVHKAAVAISQGGGQKDHIARRAVFWLGSKLGIKV